jgi:plastocyanin
MRTMTRGAIAAAAAALSLVLSAGTSSVAASSPVVITLSLDRFSKVTHLDAGDSVGVSPAAVHVHVGDTIVFVNGDRVAHHTATGLPSTRFSEPRWTQAALTQSGTIGSPGWSTGELVPGARSTPMAASATGTYLYGCFFHYSAGMRGEIVVEP